MKNLRKHRPLLPLLTLSIALIFLGVNGFIGGYLMLRDPNGTVMGMPLTYLERTPFQNWYIPGLCLIFLWGCGSFLIFAGLWLRPKWMLTDIFFQWTHEHWAWGLSIVLGFALLVWLTVQVFTLPEMAAIQFILYILAAMLIGLPLLPSMRDYFLVDVIEIEGGEKWSQA
jgi:hypothetical protein